MSILPLFYSGIVYGKTRKSIYKESDNNTFWNSGSNDGGQKVHVDDPCMSEKMEQAARKMNLKGHMAGLGPEKKLIYGPTDIEASQPPPLPLQH